MTAIPTPDPLDKTVQDGPVPARTFASGRYVVRRELGKGGQKTAYLVHDTELDRDCALSLINAAVVDGDDLARLRREAQAMARLGGHLELVTVFDIGEDDGSPYIVCEYVPGGDLRDVLQRAGGRLDLGRALEIAADVARALAVAHTHGIVHRDVKPANVWLGESAAKLGDFGLAVATDRSRMTQSGTVMGTVAYMPPEQAVGRTTDTRSDLYSLGAMMYEMVTGRVPFLGENIVAVISQHINTAPVAPSWHNAAVPESLDALILRLLAKLPEERPEGAAAVVDALVRISEMLHSPGHVADASFVSDLSGISWGRFVGRSSEMQQLQEALDGALSGRGSLAMLVGEAGIGKTRLAQEFGVYARLRGAQVLAGRCYEGEGSVPYSPFVEALRQYVRARTDDALRDELGAGAPEIATLVSEVRTRFPDIKEPPALEGGEAERLRLFESLTGLLRNAAASAPLVLLLDDLHWADKPSLLLLRYLSRNIARERVLIVATYRDVELGHDHPLVDVLATLRREPQYRRIAVEGLTADDVDELVRALEPSEELTATRQTLAAALYRDTEGNPFFIREVLSHLVEEGQLRREGGRWVISVQSISEAGVPQGVREVIGRRLSRLSEGCNRLLTRASALTGGFTWNVLKAVCDELEERLLDQLDEALAAQLIYENKQGATSWMYDFTHALIRHTLYEQLSTPRRVLLHRRISLALEALYGADADRHLSELAHHFYQAMPGGDAEKAVDYCTRAGDRAMSLFAWEEAAQHYERALQTIESLGTPEEPQRCDLLLRLARAQQNASQMQGAVETYRRASAVAREIQDPEQLTLAAVGFEESSFFIFGDIGLRREALALLDEALNHLREEETPQRVGALIARLRPAAAVSRGGQDLVSTGGLGAFLGAEDPLLLAQARETLALAERLGDAALKAAALNSMYLFVAGPGHAEERLAMSGQQIRLAREAGSALLEGQGRTARLADLVEKGDAASFRKDVAEYAAFARETRQQYHLWVAVALFGMLATAEGRLEEAERLVFEAQARGQQHGWADALTAFGAQLYTLRWLQGRLGEVEALFRQAVEQSPNVYVYQAALGLAYCETVHFDDARSMFERLAAKGFANIEEDFLWMTTMTLLSEVCAALGQARRASELYSLLLPYAHFNVPITSIVSLGSFSRSLGQLAALLERWDDADGHFQDAVEMNTRMGFHPWVAMTQLNYARMLLARASTSSAQAGDAEKARSLLQEALAAAERMGVAKVASDCRTLLA